MVDCVGCLNPTKFLFKEKLLSPLNSSNHSFHSKYGQNGFKLKSKFKGIYASPTMSTPNHPRPDSSIDVLNQGNGNLEVLQAIEGSLSNCLSETNLHLTVPGLKSKTRGKVRDIYDGGDFLVLVTTDRQSAFDRVLASIPFKGQVLNETSLWWFDQTHHITPNAVLSVPDKNVTIAKKCTIFPVEFVVRGFVTGSTDTSLWTVYKNGVRNYCGNALPDGLVKNQRLERNILTPTTKAADHDVPVTPDEIIEHGLMTKADFDEVREKALSLFAYGQRVAWEHGLILVDTKYEFGKTSDGTIVLVDEVHTPDSSRYWIAKSYEEHFRNGLEPENVDKEFLRLWFKDHCNPYEDEVLPDAPKELVCELASRIGVDSGDTINIPKGGNSGGLGETSGNLYIRLKVEDDPDFSRNGSDLHVDANISFIQAMLGGKVEVPTLAGKFSLDIPKGVQPGQVLVLRGKGLPKHGLFVNCGDQHVRFCINFPVKVNERQRAILEEIEEEEIAREENSF